MNSPTFYGYSFCCESFMADRTGIGSTTLHYLAVRQAMVSVFWAYILKSCWLTLLANQLLYTSENGFQGTIKHKGDLFLSFVQVFFDIFVWKKKIPERAPTKTCLRVLSIIDWSTITCVGMSMIRLRSIKSSLPFSLPLCPSRDNYLRPSPAFLYCKRRKARQGLGMRLGV